VGQKRLSGLEEHHPQHRVARLGDADVVVGLARLDAAVGSVDLRARGLGVDEALRLIHRGAVSQRPRPDPRRAPSSVAGRPGPDAPGLAASCAARRTVGAETDEPPVTERGQKRHAQASVGESSGGGRHSPC
jgi:hypothetical protein